MYGTTLEKIHYESDVSFLFTFEKNEKLGTVKPLWIKYVTPTIAVTYDGYETPDFFEVVFNGENTLFETSPFTLRLDDLVLAKANPPMFIAKLLWEKTRAGKELLAQIEGKSGPNNVGENK